MVTSTHSKRDHHWVLEGALSLIWLAAQWVAPALRILRRAATRVGTTATAPLRAGYRRVAAAGHRALLRVELALTGPVRDQLDTAGAKLRHRATILIIAGLMSANLLWLALR